MRRPPSLLVVLAPVLALAAEPEAPRSAPAAAIPASVRPERRGAERPEVEGAPAPATPAAGSVRPERKGGERPEVEGAPAPATPAARSVRPERRGAERPEVEGRPADPIPTLRLPSTVHPLRGALDLELDPAAPRYRGTARYEVDLAQPTSVVWLNAEGLELTSARVGTAAGGSVPARPVAGAPGFVGLALDRPVGPGAATVEVAFSGAVDRERSRGIYAEPEGSDWYAYTFFEPIDARRAFPCFDEPAAKIPWRVTLRVPAGDLALGNAPVAAERIEAGRKIVTLAETRPLPSYLVAFVVGPFDLRAAGPAGRAGVPVRIVVPRGRGEEARYAADVTPRLLSALEETLGVPYPYEKLDVAVVPRYPGMEHAGLFAIGQPMALLAPSRETPARRREYAVIAAHELAHAWFGDLVTMAWWDDTWLAESLATWLEGEAVDAVEPAGRAALERRLEARRSALAADAVPGAKRLREPVASRHEIEGAFDAALTYDKGAAVLTALERQVGPDRLRAALRRFLAARAHGVATADDLVDALGADAGPDVAAALRSAVEEPGFPRVRAEVSCANGRGVLHLSQARFLAGPAAPAEAERTYRVPLCVRYGAGKREGRACTILAARTAALPLDLCPEWLWPDADGESYAVTLRARDLPRVAVPGRLTVAERAAAADDALLLARTGALPVSDVLGLAPALAHDPDRLVAERAIDVAALAGTEELGAADQGRYARFVRATFGARARALGWLPRPSDDADARALRATLVPFVAEEGAEAVLVGEANALVRRWLADRRQVPAEVARAALPVAARSGDRALFDRIVTEARLTADREERTLLVAALGEFRAPSIAADALALSLDGGFDPRDGLGLLEAALGAPETRDGAWAFVRARFDDLSSRLRSDDGNRLLGALLGAFCDRPHRAELAAFLGPRAQAFDAGPRVLAAGLEEIDACAAGAPRGRAAASRFLARY